MLLLTINNPNTVISGKDMATLGKMIVILGRALLVLGKYGHDELNNVRENMVILSTIKVDFSTRSTNFRFRLAATQLWDAP